jgi:site-specific recombinase XerD
MLTKEQIESYRLEINGCGWAISQQGLVLVDDATEQEIKDYLREVFKLNERDNKHNKVIKSFKNYGK